jgi:hypothetical protein
MVLSSRIPNCGAPQGLVWCRAKARTRTFNSSHREPRKQAHLFDALLRTIASDLVRLRPEPRARKRRPKNYQQLTLREACLALATSYWWRHNYNARASSFWRQFDSASMAMYHTKSLAAALRTHC